MRALSPDIFSRLYNTWVPDVLMAELTSGPITSRWLCSGPHTSSTLKYWFQPHKEKGKEMPLITYSQ